MATLGQRLCELRRSRGLTQEDLARELHLSQSTISYYELDRKTPPPSTLAKLASFFGVSVDYLLGREPRESPEIPPEAVEFFARLQRLSPQAREKVLYELRWLEEWERYWSGRPSSS